jgi:hypothetical protein
VDFPETENKNEKLVEIQLSPAFKRICKKPDLFFSNPTKCWLRYFE